MSSREIPDTCVVPWASTGWTNNRNLTQMLEALMMRGEVAIAGRVGRERLWDVPDRVYPADVVVPSVEEANRLKNERRLASLGIARQKARAMPMEPIHVGEAGEPAVVEGVKGEWRVDSAALGEDFEGRTALLSPFDRLVHDRVRAEELFDFEYTLEMYKPATKRRWGYFALPILHDDRLVGKVDATADRKASALRVHAIHEDVRFTRTMTKRLCTPNSRIWPHGSGWARSNRLRNERPLGSTSGRRGSRETGARDSNRRIDLRPLRSSAPTIVVCDTRFSVRAAWAVSSVGRSPAPVRMSCSCSGRRRSCATRLGCASRASSSVISRWTSRPLRRSTERSTSSG